MNIDSIVLRLQMYISKLIPFEPIQELFNFTNRIISKKEIYI